MNRFSRMQIRLSSEQMRQLKKLAARTGIDRTNLIRLAISRLMEDEDLRLAAKKNAPRPQLPDASS